MQAGVAEIHLQARLRRRIALEHGGNVLAISANRCGIDPGFKAKNQAGTGDVGISSASFRSPSKRILLR